MTGKIDVEACDQRGLAWEIIPGVSSLGAAAAVIGRELTVPEVAQSVILTRLPTATPMPGNEDIRSFAAIGTTMALFLSAKRGRKLQDELIAGGYAPGSKPEPEWNIRSNAKAARSVFLSGVPLLKR